MKRRRQNKVVVATLSPVGLRPLKLRSYAMR